MPAMAGRSTASACARAAPSWQLLPNPGRVVTNGMSQYSRNERNANAGIVVAIDPATDYPGGPLAGVALQEELESQAYVLGGSDYSAPGQLVGDFLRGVASTGFGAVKPSLYTRRQTQRSFGLAACVCRRSDPEALGAFGSQIRGFDRDDAVLTAVESRTSSPLRITRDPESLQSLNVRGLYPLRRGCGLCRRHSLCRRRRHPGGGGRGTEPVMKFEDIRKLHQKKFREESGCFLVEGEHLVHELQKAAAHDARLRESEVYLTREFEHWVSPLRTHLVNSRHMMQISETRSPQGIAAVVPLLTAPAARRGERAVYLHEIQDPGNLGTILRTLAWFGGFRCLPQPRQRRRAQRQGRAGQHGRGVPCARRDRRAAAVTARPLRTHREP